MTVPSSFPRPRISFRHLLPWSWVVTFSRKVAPPAVPTKEEDEAAYLRPWMPPPFKIGDVRAAIPSHCWVKNPWRSLSYVLRDAVVVAALALAAARFDSWAFWPVYWIAQGTMFWAIFVLGHDWYSFSKAPNMTIMPLFFFLIFVYPLFERLETGNIKLLVSTFGSGHGSFSNSVWLNNLVGHLLHSSILVPYHGW